MHSTLARTLALLASLVCVSATSAERPPLIATKGKLTGTKFCEAYQCRLLADGVDNRTFQNVQTYSLQKYPAVRINLPRKGSDGRDNRFGTLTVSWNANPARLTRKDFEFTSSFVEELLGADAAKGFDAWALCESARKAPNGMALGPTLASDSIGFAVSSRCGIDSKQIVLSLFVLRQPE